MPNISVPSGTTASNPFGKSCVTGPSLTKYSKALVATSFDSVCGNFNVCAAAIPLASNKYNCLAAVSFTSSSFSSSSLFSPFSSLSPSSSSSSKRSTASASSGGSISSLDCSPSKQPTKVSDINTNTKKL